MRSVQWIEFESEMMKSTGGGRLHIQHDCTQRHRTVHFEMFKTVNLNSKFKSFTIIKNR